MWDSIQYVGTGLSLVAFVVAAILLAYRARLKQRAEIIKSAPEKERLEAIAATAEFFRVDVSGLTRAQQQDIVLAQIHARAQRDLLFAGVTLVVAVLLAMVAIISIVISKPAAFSENCCIISGRLIDKEQKPVHDARVYAYLLNDGRVGETKTDERGMYALRIKQGYIVDILYDSPDGQ